MKKKISITAIIVLLAGAVFAQKLNTAKLDSLFNVLGTKDKFMGSIEMAENGKTIYSRSIGKADRETGKDITAATKFRIGSITKIFTGCLVMKAVEEKKLALDQTLDNYFPEVENAKKITLENLLMHRSGIHDFTHDTAYQQYYTQPKSQKEMVEIIAKGKSDFEPGSKFEYSNSNYVLLTFILEKTYKKPYAKLLEEKITKPLGLKNTYYGSQIDLQRNESNPYSFDEKWVKEKETDMSIPLGAGAIVSNPSDLNIFIESLFAHKIVNEKSLGLMLQMKDGYGLGIRQLFFPDHLAYGHGGAIDGFTSALCYFPEEKLSIAITSNGAAYSTKQILKAAASAYYGFDFEIPQFNTIELTPEELNAYVGDYSNAELQLDIAISVVDGKLVAQSPGQSALQLEAAEKNIFVFVNGGIKLEFKPAENQMLLHQGGETMVLTKKVKQ